MVTIAFATLGFSLSLLPVIKQISESKYIETPQKAIKPTAVIKDNFMRYLDINRSYLNDMKRILNKSRSNNSKNYIISLTKKEQLALANTTMAIQLRIAKENGHEFESLQNVGPFEFLREFKSPCWYNVNRELRCLPYFYLIGAPKSGSTDLYNMVLTHPDFRPFKKEYHWLTLKRFCASPNHRTCSGMSFDEYTKQIALPLSNLPKSKRLSTSREKL